MPLLVSAYVFGDFELVFDCQVNFKKVTVNNILKIYVF